MKRFALVGSFVLLSACDPGVQLGSRCEYTSQCPLGLVCGFGRCRSECRAQRDCSLGALCLLDADGIGTCALPDDPDCRGAGESCASSLACIGGECVNACESVAQCPDGSECTPADDGRARCVRVDVADGGTLPDASIDAGTQCHGALCDPIAQIAVGMYHACARTERAGAIWCWGEATGLGPGDDVTPGTCASDIPCSVTPLQVVRVDPVSETEVPVAGALDVSAGESFSCAILAEDARLWCWGGGGATSTGDPGGGKHALRVRLAAGGFAGRARDVASARSAGLALMEDGTVLGWGGDEGGLLGSSGSAYVPLATTLPIGAPSDATRLIAGGYHACVISAAGEPSCWGWNDYGQLGRIPPMPAMVSFDATSARVADLSGIRALSAGNEHGCAILGDDAWCWGGEPYLGRFEPPPGDDCAGIVDRACTVTPQRVFRESTSPFVALAAAANAFHDCALTASGEVWCWGASSAIGPAAPYREPRRIALPGPASQVATGKTFACAIVDGDVWCWGADDRGQLGRGVEVPDDSTPAEVALP